MSLPRFSIRRPVTTVMIYVGVLLLGCIAWSRLPQELYPPIAYPQLTIVTHYKDAAPEEIEILITKPIEEVVGTVSGLRRVSSISKEEVSLVVAEFNWGQNMDFAGLGVREKLDLIKERLPRGAEDPVVIKFNPFELPVMVLNVSGRFTSHELLEIGRKSLKNELEKVEGVAAVHISGGLEREILVEVDQGRLQASGLPIAQVVEALSRANLNYPAGTIKEAFYEYLIRTMGEFEVVPEIPKIAVGVEEEKEKVPKREPSSSERAGPLKREKGIAPPQRIILLKDLATVRDTFKERSSISRFNGQENISLNIQKQAGANTLQVATRVKEVLMRLKPSLPLGLTVEVAYDQSVFIRNAIAGVRDAATQGGFLAFLVLFLFLGNAWSAVNVAFAIPISILATVAFMYFFGVTVNVISLGGLALGIGLLVDAGIVVVENIARHRDQLKVPGTSEEAKRDALEETAVRGTEEVSSAILGTVLTTVVVFLPMVFVVGIAGQLFKDLAYTVTASNLVSLVVSMTLTALLASRIRSGPGRSPIEPWIDRLALEDRRWVGWFLRHPVVGVAVVVGLFGVSVNGLKTLDRELLPRVDQGQFILRANLSPGTRLEVTDRVARRVEEVLRALPEVMDVTVRIGSSKERRAEELLETLGSHQAQILVNLKPRYRGWGRATANFRARKTAEVVQELKETLKREPLEGAEIEYLVQETTFKSAFLSGTPVVIEVKGTDLGRVEGLSRQVREILEKVPGLYGVKTSLIPPSPETKVHVMKDRAATYHLSVNDIALTAQTAVKGVVATKFKQEGKEIDLRVRLRRADREDLNKVRRLMIHSPLEVDIPLAEVAYFVVGHGPTEIRHLDQQRTILVSAQLFQRSLNETLQEVTDRLKGIRLPPGYTVALTGENRQMQESFRSLIMALILSVVLVYMVMASEFESLWQPFLIMGTIPMALIGVVWTLWMTHTPISVMVGLGFIVLGGIVVDNGIVLIDYVNLLRRQGKGLEEAVIEASQTRLRPILMTASTTVLGLLPLALGLGEGVELQTPMAITVMGGLTLSTFLTLIFLPTIYVVGAKFFERFHPATVPVPEVPATAFSQVLSSGARDLAFKPELPEIPEDFGGEEAVPESTPSTEVPGTILSMVPGTTSSPTYPPLNPRQQQLLEHLKIHGRITRKEVVELTGASVPTSARDLKDLLDRGLIKGIGPLAKGRYYVLT